MPNLANSLVLFRYMLKLLGYDKWEDVSRDLHHPRYEEISSDGHTEIAHFLASRLRGYVPPCGLTPLTEAKLYEYDENVIRHTERINSFRRRYGEEIRWRYFQYLALLFTEIFLDRFLGQGTQFRGELNYYLEHCLVKESARDYSFLSSYMDADLRKIAFWMATGSGKTLIMHMNYLQFQHYAEKYGLWKNINQVILLTPNPGLSRQHLEECHKSGLPAEIFSKEGSPLLRKGTIQIIHIQKLRKEGKEETVSVEEFGERNFVLVDEGHKGAGGVEWFDIRERLCRVGFSFEYSATFGQAIKYSSGKGSNQQAQRKHFDRYAKTILFDYSYKHFYEDGFGKDYRIFNISPSGGKKALSKTERDLYLTAGLLTLYQQMELYQGNPEKAAEFNLEKPLWIFIGGKVISGKSEAEISDVWKVVHFLAEFLCDPKGAINRIKRVIEGRSELRDREGRDLFPEGYFFPKGYFKDFPRDPKAIYRGILERVFNEKIADHSEITVSRKLELVHFKDSEGEIGLRLKGRPYFGLINIGAPDAFLKSGEHSCVSVAPAEPFTKSLFEKINHPESPVNILIGARKFTEGWNSWRVSVMGLINFGKSEGPLVIQLFGRGVRLKGYRFSLKRSREISNLFPEADPPEWLPELETLYVFGLKADYIAKFEEYLKKEGVPTNEEISVCTLPVICNFAPPEETFLCENDGALLGVRLRGQVRFPDRGNILKLGGRPDPAIVSRPIKLDWSARAVVYESESTATGSTGQHQILVIPDYLTELLDWDDICREIDRYRRFKGMRNLVFSKDSLKDLILADGTKNNRWYELYGPSYLLCLEHLGEIRQIVISLLKKYLDRLYDNKRRGWESETVGFECYPVSIHDPNFEFIHHQGGYRIEIPPEAKCADGICDLIDVVDQAIDEGGLKDHDFCNRACRALFFERHLYSPLIYARKGKNGLAIKVSPVTLEESELCFVECLRRWCQRRAKKLKRDGTEVYLLRNQSGKGMKFSLSSGDFYPDFVLWFCTPEVQYITFVDPKGLHNVPLDHPKIELAQDIKKIEQDLNKNRTSNDCPKVVLNSFILSPTHRRDLVDSSYRDKSEDELAKKHHVLFMDCEGKNLADELDSETNVCEVAGCLSSCFVEKMFSLIINGRRLEGGSSGNTNRANTLTVKEVEDPKLSPMLQAVRDLLLEAGEPLSVTEIRQLAEERGIRLTEAAFPDDAIRGALENHLRKFGSGRPFVKVKISGKGRGKVHYDIAR